MASLSVGPRFDAELHLNYTTFPAEIRPCGLPNGFPEFRIASTKLEGYCRWYSRACFTPRAKHCFRSRRCAAQPYAVGTRFSPYGAVRFRIISSWRITSRAPIPQMCFCSIENARRVPSTTIAVYRTVSRSRYSASTKGSTYSSWCVPPLNPSLITPPPVSPSSHSGLTSCPSSRATNAPFVPSALLDNQRKGHWQMDNRKQRRELLLR